MQKVLIVTYYWPPAGGPGVQRWLKFITYLPQFDIEPIVFIPDNPTYPLLDETLLDELPNELKVIRHPIWEPYGWASFFSKKKTKRISSGVIQKHQKQGLLERLMLWVRGNFFIPDARKFWVKPSITKLRSLITDENIQTVVTTGPPHSMHLIGLGLKEELDVKWVADFRDPWTSIGYHEKLKLTKRSQKRHKKLENKVLKTADELVVTSKTTKRGFEMRTTKPISVITNGFEGQERNVPLDDTFSISHIGSLLTDRNPMVLWKVLSDLIQQNDDFRKKLQINLVGVVGDGVMDSIKSLGLERYVNTPGYLSHNTILDYQSKSQVLLLLEIDSKQTQEIIPGKLFEYFKAQRPILAMGPNNWEAGNMVEAHKAGTYLLMHQEEALKEVLLKWFKAFQDGILKITPVETEQYHRRELTRAMAKILRWESS